MVTTRNGAGTLVEFLDYPVKRPVSGSLIEYPVVLFAGLAIASA
jgi:hypothetical protein